MKSLYALQELIRNDCNKILHNLDVIHQLKFLEKEEDFQKAKNLWQECGMIARRLHKLEYKEEHLIDVARKHILLSLEDLRNRIRREIG